MNKILRIIRKPELREKMGIGSDSGVYAHVEEGTLSPPVKIGLRASGWPEHEVYAINAARIAGKSDDEIRELVKTLIAKRQQLADEILVVCGNGKRPALKSFMVFLKKPCRGFRGLDRIEPFVVRVIYL